MKKIFKILLVILFCLLISTLYAKNNSGVETAKKLFKTLHLSDTYQQTINKGVDFQIRANPQLAPFKNVMLSFFKKYMGWDSIKGDLAKIYSEKFTVDEMNELIKFYKTPVGKKSIKLMPYLYEQGSILGQKKVQEHISELQQMIAKEAKKLQKQQKK
jgi:hypothetical protein